MPVKFTDLRRKHPYFIFHHFSYAQDKNNLHLKFDFQIEPDIHFSPRATIKNINHSFLAKIPEAVLNNLIFHLGLMEIPSYWKATCSPQIVIRAGYLNPQQVNWWRQLFIEGMGQFYYTNKIDLRNQDFLKIAIESSKRYSLTQQKFNPKRFLVPIGGGKDSVVTLEILKKAGGVVIPFLVNPSHNPLKAALHVIKTSGVKDQLIIRRELDKKLFALNQAGYLNGHTPITAYNSFASVLAAVVSNCGQIAFSNERSANEGNVVYLGREINHQYSKTWSFEKKFIRYLKKYLAPKINYFSFLRPLYELQIAKLFAHYPQYFSVFRSCNRGQKTNSWCGQCPKCLFIFITLYPFLSTKQVLSIFSHNPFTKKELWPLTKELSGLAKAKPFECVGTYQETRIAFLLALKKAKKEARVLPLILKRFQIEILPQFPKLEKEAKNLLASFSKEHLLPPNLEQLLKDESQRS